jgi:hypothetical protein
MSPLNEQIYSVHIFVVKRSELHSLSVGFSVAQRAFFKLNDRDQELFAVIGGDDLSV